MRWGSKLCEGTGKEVGSGKRRWSVVTGASGVQVQGV